MKSDSNTKKTTKTPKAIHRIDVEDSLGDLSVHAREVWELLEPLEHEGQIPLQFQYQIGGIGRLAKQLEERLNQFSAGLLPTLAEPKKTKKSGGAA